MCHSIWVCMGVCLHSNLVSHSLCVCASDVCVCVRVCVYVRVVYDVQECVGGLLLVPRVSVVWSG